MVGWHDLGYHGPLQVQYFTLEYIVEYPNRNCTLHHLSSQLHSSSLEKEMHFMLYTLHLPLLSCPPASPGSWPLCSDWWAMEMGAVFYPAHFPFPRQPLSYLHVCIAHGVCVTTCLASWRYPMTSGDPRLGLSQPARHLSCQPKSFFFSESGCRD